MIHDAKIVAPFKNRREPASVVSDSFQGGAETLSALVERLSAMPVEEGQRQLQKAVVGGPRDATLIGRYSIFHDNAVYHKGVNAPMALRLACV